MKILVIYRTFFGSSKKYAEWLHNAVPSDIMKFSKAGANVIETYDAVVIFGGTDAGNLSMGGYLKKNWKTLQAKKVVFVTVGGAPEIDLVSIRAYSKVPENMRAAVKHFHLRGKLGKTNADEFTKEKILPIASYLLGK